MEDGNPLCVSRYMTSEPLDDINASRYDRLILIRSFRNKETENIFRRERVNKFAPAVQRAALRKLLLLDAAESLADPRVPPSNRLEKLAGDRKGQYNIRINDQWRICFHWGEGDAFDVEITDHQ